MEKISTTQKYPKNWDLAEAVMLVRDIEAIASNLGAHAAITGGVLFKGASDKDLDIIVYPHNSDEGYDKDVILKKLAEDVGIEAPFQTKSCDSYERDSKDVTVNLYHGKRIDFFWLRQ